MSKEKLSRPHLKALSFFSFFLFALRASVLSRDGRHDDSGVDVGSVAAKAVILADGKVAGRGMAPTGADPALAAETAWAKALEAAGADRASVSRVVTTGYGRRATRLSGDVVTEISAAARGAFWLGAPGAAFGSSRTSAARTRR